VRLKFILTQHNRDDELMGSLVEYLACGGYYPFIPAVVYSNPDLYKERVIKENRGKSGIYR